jgi:vesicle-associated membrane protein 72
LTLLVFCAPPQADHFHRSGRSLRRKLWWNNVKLKLLIAVIALVALFAAVMSACASTQQCWKKH